MGGGRITAGGSGCVSCQCVCVCDTCTVFTFQYLTLLADVRFWADSVLFIDE